VGRTRNRCGRFITLRSVGPLAAVPAITVAGTSFAPVFAVRAVTANRVTVRMGFQHGIRARGLRIPEVRHHADRTRCARQGIRLGGFCATGFARAGGTALASVTASFATVTPVTAALAAFPARRTLGALFSPGPLHSGLEFGGDAFGRGPIHVPALARTLTFTTAFAAAFTRLAHFFPTDAGLGARLLAL
jgi:hypothetical protein